MSTDLASLIRLRYPRLLERGNPLYDATLAAAVEEQEKADVVTVPREEWQLVDASLSTRRAIDRCENFDRYVRLHHRMARLEIKLDALRSIPTTEATP